MNPQSELEHTRLVAAQASVIEWSVKHGRIRFLSVVNPLVLPARRHEGQNVIQELLACARWPLSKVRRRAGSDAEIDFVPVPKHPGQVFLHGL